MKIDDRAGVRNVFESSVSDEKGRRAPGALEFNKIFNEYEQVDACANLADMIAKIEKQGQRLAQTLNINELRYYRKMISEFLHQAMHISCLFEKESVSDSRGRLRKYALVKKINQKADDLMKKIIDEEAPNIEVLKMIDDIRGLLLDLAM